jgi:hypothetical protein
MGQQHGPGLYSRYAPGGPTLIKRCARKFQRTGHGACYHHSGLVSNLQTITFSAVSTGDEPVL